MKSWPKMGAKLLLFVAVFLLILSGPLLIGTEDGRVVLRPQAVVQELQIFVEDLLQGNSFEYQAGRTYFDIRDTLPKFFFTSLKFILSAALISLVFGIGLGILFSFRRGALLEGILNFLHVLPDFLVALFLQILSITFYQTFHVRLARLAYIDESMPAYLLPLLTMILTASVFIIRSVEGYAHRVKGEEYILYAKSRGLSRLSLVGTHLLVPVLHYLRTDFHRLLALMVGNLFIIERIFSIPGITSFVFQYSFQRRYESLSDEILQIFQLNVAFWGFLAVILVYWIAYFFIDFITKRFISWRAA